LFLVRQHAVAGAFYPEQRQALSRDLRAMLDAAWPASASALPAPKAIVVPHAGYIYLQTVLDDFTLLPLAVGDATAQEVAQVLEAVWGGPETLLVISSDLSHFLHYEHAQAVDDETVHRILALDSSLSHSQACGGTPVNGLLLAASQHQLEPQLLGLCNSGDTAGDRSRVVGYAAIAFVERPRHVH